MKFECLHWSECEKVVADIQIGPFFLCTRVVLSLTMNSHITSTYHLALVAL
ncbi:hypothetical protein BgiBS90_015276, partial [Biomphalaria glabrata]